MMRRSFKNTDRTGSPDRVVKYVESAAYKAVRLPYKGCSISAIAVLPSEQAVQKHGFAAAIAELDVDELLDASKYRKVSPMGLELEMPRFTVKNECMSLSSVSLLRLISISAAAPTGPCSLAPAAQLPGRHWCVTYVTGYGMAPTT
jgi:serine protease inhibitor